MCVCAELDVADLRILKANLIQTFKLTLCYCNLMNSKSKSMLTRDVILLLCDLKRFQITTGNTDHSPIIRKEIN